MMTVDAAAEELQLHPKTVLRAIRTGRLRATRIGKAYRILRADLDAFAGVPPHEADDELLEPWVTVIVDMPDMDPKDARSWGMLPASLRAPADQLPLRADVIYEVERRHLKIIVVGSVERTTAVLGMIRARLKRA